MPAWRWPGRDPCRPRTRGTPARRAHLAALATAGRVRRAPCRAPCGRARLAQGISGIPVVFDAVDSIAHLFEQTVRHAARWPQRLAARLELRRTERFEARAPYLFQRMLVTSPVDKDAFVRLAGSEVGVAHRRRAERRGLGVFRPGPGCPRTVHDHLHGQDELSRERGRGPPPGAPDHARGVGPQAGGETHPCRQGPVSRRAGARRRPARRGDGLRRRPAAALLARATVAVSPLLYGAGIQNKILEAMASGVPVVTSPQACGSLSALPGEDLLTGDAPAELARQVLRILEDDGLADRLRSGGLDVRAPLPRLVRNRPTARRGLSSSDTWRAMLSARDSRAGLKTG